MLLAGCTVSHPNIPSSEGETYREGSSHNGSSSSSEQGGGQSWTSVEDDETDDCPIQSVSMTNSEIYLNVGAHEYLTVEFVPDNLDVDTKQGVWTIEDSSIATISQYGKVTGVKKGETNLGHRRARCHIYIVNSQSDVTKEWKKVTDMDSIKEGDTLCFGCPELGVVASLEKVSGYLKTVSATFSGDKITNLPSSAGTYYVGEGEGEALTLENQEGNYLAGKYTEQGGGLVFVHSKGQINWVFEHVNETGLDYCVNYDIATDLWLMFNKINNTDIRFNLYDSNPTSLMIMPTIYRYTVTFNV